MGRGDNNNARGNTPSSAGPEHQSEPLADTRAQQFSGKPGCSSKHRIIGFGCIKTEAIASLPSDQRCSNPNQPSTRHYFGWLNAVADSIGAAFGYAFCDQLATEE